MLTGVSRCPTSIRCPLRSAGALLVAAALAACESPPPEPAAGVAQPDGWADDLALSIPVDINPDPDVVEINLDARVADVEFLPGIATPAWTYGGTVPGPLIRAKVGDRIIVNFTNELPEGTSIHWHGMRVPNQMDGVPGVTQDPTMPGESFRYEFVARDAGTFWYHPHINSSAQVGWGMYGAVLIEDPSDSASFGDDLVLVLSDISLTDVGEFLPADNGGEFGDLFGREGSVLLVNGRLTPTLKARVGKPQRWRIINAARARYYNVRMPGHSLTRLGGDNGLAARSEEIYSVVIVPGERADVVFTPQGEPGSADMLEWVPVDRGFSSTFNRSREPMLALDIVDLPAVEPASIPVELREIEPLDLTGAIEQTLDMTIETNFRNEVVMGINGIPYWNVVPIEAKTGQTQIWRLTNETAFAHPFHLHGYFFQVLDDSRIPEWKDTVDLPSESELSIAVRFDERPGTWMYHCHILDHAESGMMGQVRVTAN
ncbi:MAG TPA: multicopper oxidase family protein [Gammaproteobacteria bacterium]